MLPSRDVREILHPSAAVNQCPASVSSAGTSSSKLRQSGFMAPIALCCVQALGVQDILAVQVSRRLLEEFLKR